MLQIAAPFFLKIYYFYGWVMVSSRHPWQLKARKLENCMVDSVNLLLTFMADNLQQLPT